MSFDTDMPNDGEPYMFGVPVSDWHDAVIKGARIHGAHILTIDGLRLSGLYGGIDVTYATDNGVGKTELAFQSHMVVTPVALGKGIGEMLKRGG